VPRETRDDLFGEERLDAPAMQLADLRRPEGRGQVEPERVFVVGERATSDLYYRLRRIVLRVRRFGNGAVTSRSSWSSCGVRRLPGMGFPSPGWVTTPTLDVLLHHSWPANVRELEAVLELAMIFHGTGWLRPQDLELPRGRTRGRAAPATQAGPVG